MNESAIPSFLQEIADAFGAIDGVEAVVWCGSAALGNADAFSDFDLYVYTNAPVPVEAREAVIAKRAIDLQKERLMLGAAGIEPPTPPM